MIYIIFYILSSEAAESAMEPRLLFREFERNGNITTQNVWKKAYLGQGQIVSIEFDLTKYNWSRAGATQKKFLQEIAPICKHFVSTTPYVSFGTET